MNKSELIAAVANYTGESRKTVDAVLDGLIEVLSDSLAKEDPVQLVGFGTFATKDRPERQGRNPQTGETMTIAARRAVVFKPGKVLRERVDI